jgi:hypothetical protein
MYHFNVSDGGYAERWDISAWGVHPVKLQMYVPILVFYPIESYCQRLTCQNITSRVSILSTWLSTA